MKIRIDRLSYSYDGFTLSVSGLVLAEGRLTSIVGPNGAGKSTLLKCLACILPLRPRTVAIDGRDLAVLKGKERARLLGYVPQEPVFLFNYSVLDFVLTGRAAYVPFFATPTRHDVEAAKESLRYVGLADFSDRSLFELSSGERRLALIARTLAQEPDVLLLDEPTTFLDPRHESEVLGLVRRLADERRKTVIVTLHNLDMAIKHSDEMVFLKDGRVVASGPPDAVLSEALLRDVYDIEMGIIHAGGRRLIVR